jgi:peptidoglycan-associated lipoprotein
VGDRVLTLASDRLKVVGCGKQKPVCDEHDEACWQRNRRIHITAMAQ